MKPGPKPQRRFCVRAPIASIGTHGDAARAMGVSRSQILRFLADGATPASADRVAIAAGRHPVEVWPDFYDDQ